MFAIHVVVPRLFRKILRQNLEIGKTLLPSPYLSRLLTK
jgi:hypothetical protein